MINDNDDTHNDNDNENHLDTIRIFNTLHIVISKQEVNDVYICGKMFSHSTLAHYSFKACEFYIYDPNVNCLYHSIMNSEQCFTNAIKWTFSLFKRIRNALVNPPSPKKSKKMYFTIVTRYNEMNDDVREDEIGSVEKKYLELHFVKDKDDIIVFRLLLQAIVEENPFVFMLEKGIMLDKEEDEVLMSKCARFSNKVNEIERIESEISENEKMYEKKQKEMIVKFYLLNQEKNNKIKLLQDELLSKPD